MLEFLIFIVVVIGGAVFARYAYKKEKEAIQENKTDSFFYPKPHIIEQERQRLEFLEKHKKKSSKEK